MNDTVGGRLVRGRDLVGMSLMSLDAGSKLGEIKDIYYTPGDSRVVAFTVRDASLLGSPARGVLPIDAVRAIGRDAVMVASAGAMLSEREAGELGTAATHEVIGKEVVVDTGVSLGRVHDLVLQVVGGGADVVGYEVDTGDRGLVVIPIPPEAEAAGDVLVVPATVGDMAVESNAGLSELPGSVTTK